MYKNNAMEVHYALNKIFPLQKKHFTARLHLFNCTLDKMYEGKITLLAKKQQPLSCPDAAQTEYK